MPERKLSPEKEKEWNEVMEQIREEIDALPPYIGGYFNNTAASGRYNEIIDRYREKLDAIVGKTSQEVVKKVGHKMFSDLIAKKAEPLHIPDHLKKK